MAYHGTAAAVAPLMSRKRWAQRVIELQSQRNPEEITAAQSRIERARQHEVCARKCKAVKGLAVRSRALAAEGLNQMAQSSAPEEYMAVQDRWRCAQDVSRTRQEKKCLKLGRTKFKARRSRSASSSSSGSGDAKASRSHRRRGRAAQRRHEAKADAGVQPHVGAAGRVDSGSDMDQSRSSSLASLLRAASDSEEDAMEEAAGLVGASDANAMAIVGTAGLPSAPGQTRSREHAGSESEGEDSEHEGHQHDFSGGSDANSESADDDDVRRRPAPKDATTDVVAALLQQLAKEPSEESECAAKFSLYEGYASEVENMRNTLFKFHEESRPVLPQAIVTDMDRSIQGIDCEDAMRIPDRSREWFVYHMMRQAERNNSNMAGILDRFEKKLKFLAQNDQVECPVCLDAFDSGVKAAETLGCCHKVCKECWQNWTKVTHGRPFCPFCRHEDFIGAVAARASDPAHDSDSDIDDIE